MSSRSSTGTGSAEPNGRGPGRHGAPRLFGDPDYLLRVVAADIEAYASIRDERLATLPGVQRITSTIVMRQVVDIVRCR
jgi:DNA-binding Lrp family transcriptional regulator